MIQPFPSHLLESWSAEKVDKFLEFTYNESGLYEQSGGMGSESEISVESGYLFDDFIHEAIQGRNLLSALQKYTTPRYYSEDHFIESKNEVKLLVKDEMYAEDVYFNHTTNHIFNDPYLFKQIQELDLKQRSEYTTRLGTL